MATSTSKGGRKSGPDLLAPAGMADSNRILSQLEHGSMPLYALRPPLHWRPGWLAIAGVVPGIMFLVLAWLACEAMLAAPKQTPAVVQRSTLPAAAPSPAEMHVPAAATIINLPPAAEPAPQAAAAAQHKQHAPARQATARAMPLKPRPSATASDSDVTLLAAILAHGKQSAPPRDVVLRKHEEETASLLQRCRQLGLIEGMLCRARICAGRWDSDPACH